MKINERAKFIYIKQYINESCIFSAVPYKLAFT